MTEPRIASTDDTPMSDDDLRELLMRARTLDEPRLARAVPLPEGRRRPQRQGPATTGDLERAGRVERVAAGLRVVGAEQARRGVGLRTGQRGIRRRDVLDGARLGERRLPGCLVVPPSDDRVELRVDVTVAHGCLARVGVEHRNPATSTPA